MNYHYGSLGKFTGSEIGQSGERQSQMRDWFEPVLSPGFPASVQTFFRNITAESGEACAATIWKWIHPTYNTLGYNSFHTAPIVLQLVPPMIPGGWYAIGYLRFFQDADGRFACRLFFILLDEAVFGQTYEYNAFHLVRSGFLAKMWQQTLPTWSTERNRPQPLPLPQPCALPAISSQIENYLQQNLATPLAAGVPIGFGFTPAEWPSAGSVLECIVRTFRSAMPAMIRTFSFVSMAGVSEHRDFRMVAYPLPSGSPHQLDLFSQYPAPLQLEKPMPGRTVPKTDVSVQLFHASSPTGSTPTGSTTPIPPAMPTTPIPDKTVTTGGHTPEYRQLRPVEDGLPPASEKESWQSRWSALRWRLDNYLRLLREKRAQLQNELGEGGQERAWQLRLLWEKLQANRTPLVLAILALAILLGTVFFWPKGSKPGEQPIFAPATTATKVEPVTTVATATKVEPKPTTMATTETKVEPVTTVMTETKVEPATRITTETKTEPSTTVTTAIKVEPVIPVRPVPQGTEDIFTRLTNEGESLKQDKSFWEKLGLQLRDNLSDAYRKSPQQPDYQRDLERVWRAEERTREIQQIEERYFAFLKEFAKFQDCNKPDSFWNEYLRLRQQQKKWHDHLTTVAKMLDAENNVPENIDMLRQTQPDFLLWSDEKICSLASSYQTWIQERQKKWLTEPIADLAKRLIALRFLPRKDVDFGYVSKKTREAASIPVECQTHFLAMLSDRQNFWERTFSEKCPGYPAYAKWLADQWHSALQTRHAELVPRWDDWWQNRQAWSESVTKWQKELLEYQTNLIGLDQTLDKQIRAWRQVTDTTSKAGSEMNLCLAQSPGWILSDLSGNSDFQELTKVDGNMGWKLAIKKLTATRTQLRKAMEDLATLQTTAQGNGAVFQKAQRQKEAINSYLAKIPDGDKWNKMGERFDRSETISLAQLQKICSLVDTDSSSLLFAKALSDNASLELITSAQKLYKQHEPLLKVVGTFFTKRMQSLENAKRDRVSELYARAYQSHDKIPDKAALETKKKQCADYLKYREDTEVKTYLNYLMPKEYQVFLEKGSYSGKEYGKAKLSVQVWQNEKSIFSQPSEENDFPLWDKPFPITWQAFDKITIRVNNATDGHTDRRLAKDFDDIFSIQALATTHTQGKITIVFGYHQAINELKLPSLTRPDVKKSGQEWNTGWKED